MQWVVKIVPKDIQGEFARSGEADGLDFHIFVMRSKKVIEEAGFPDAGEAYVPSTVLRSAQRFEQNLLMIGQLDWLGGIQDFYRMKPLHRDRNDIKVSLHDERFVCIKNKTFTFIQMRVAKQASPTEVGNANGEFFPSGASRKTESLSLISRCSGHDLGARNRSPAGQTKYE